jgi:hypothetical protein
MYDLRSTPELFVYHLAGLASPFQIKDSPPVGVGDGLSVVHSDANGQLRVLLNACTVKALSRDWELKLRNGETRYLDELLEIDRRFPEGTPLISDDRLAGIIVIGSRFGADGATTSLAVPADRIQALIGQNVQEKK